MAAQTDPAPGLFDNATLDRWEIPFGDWFDQGVDWIDNNLGGLLGAIEAPFNYLIDLIVNNILLSVSWVLVVLAMGLIGALIRNVKVGAFVMVALTVCGLLGPGYWIETARTIGFIAVAVLLCVLVGIPIGVAAGRIDGVWKSTRPILDAMQVVHSFVYMIPFIFFWGIGEVSATMVTMIFAIPPLIRLTNLGIRQVPGDVVEAARAHGAPEWRVLFDVQLPLARPAIMTGINQTLLLAISMLGIAAIMGAGGLGRLLFRSLSNQDVALAASAGLAFFLVAVVLDRISQREGTDGGNLLRRIRDAWAHRGDPEALLPEQGTSARVRTERYEPWVPTERAAMGTALVGGLVSIVSAFLPWTENAGWISAFGTRAHEDLSGMTFSGLDAAGGSFFGILVLAAGAFVVTSVVSVFVWRGRGLRWLSVDGALLASFAGLASGAVFALSSPSSLAPGAATSLGVLVSVLGGAIAAVGSILWLRVAPHTALHPLRADRQWGRIIGAVLGVFLIVTGALGGWSFDERTDVVISAELQEEIDVLRASAEGDPVKASVVANEIAALIAAAQATDTVITTGLADEGAGVGLWTMLLGLAALGTSLPAAALFGPDERRQWFWSSLTAGLASAIVAVAFAWVFTFVRSADLGFIAGLGAFLTLTGGFFVLSSTMSVMKEFRRSRVYDDEPRPSEREEIEAPAEELV